MALALRRGGARHGLLTIAYLVYLVAVGILVFQPTGDQASGSVLWVSHLLHSWHAASWLSGPVHVEWGLNVLMFVPLSLLGSYFRPGWTWRDWIGVGFVASGVIELVQLVFLPDRAASFSDVVANTLGALIGALLAPYASRLLR
ncbi:MAG TPA: VanZ family protein [Nocardioidaceae bacterium]|jgi:glycopeptide antibiotics resistance protein|nr:VanZ family protein [Nocardioidaceae bacterium]HEU5045325.1 VanZ family protein [Nocardioidaceae bacterium]